jgi:hypothetical protein
MGICTYEQRELHEPMTPITLASPAYALASAAHRAGDGPWPGAESSQTW